MNMGHGDKNVNFCEVLRGRTMILDGAAGTMLWRDGLTHCEALNVQNSDAVAALHRRYVAAGADIITANTTCANGMDMNADMAVKLARRGAEIAAGVAKECAATRKVWVAGSMGPTGVPLTKCQEREAVVEAAFASQAEALMTGGVDLLLVETCYDVRNALAAMRGIATAHERLGRSVPVVVTGTVGDDHVRIASGQTLGQLCAAVRQVGAVAAFGLNCSFGVSDGLVGLVERLATEVELPLVVYPSAGMPDASGRYGLPPERFAEVMCRVAAVDGVKIVGGCCGTTPRHVAALSKAMKSHGA